MSSSLYDQIGVQKIREVIQAFYDRAFEDSIIGYFFENVDKASIVEKQTKFSVALLGGPKEFSGQSLHQAHAHLKIRPAHFGRRQVIMAEVLEGSTISPEIAKHWLAVEEKLKPLIVHGKTCTSP